MTSSSSWPALFGAPTVQTRLSIARPPSPPTEDSDVLVLSSRSTLHDSSTVGSSVLYLDLRLFLPVTKSASINWAFAGLRETIPLLEEQAEAVRYRWEHTIDSHGSGEPPDEGTMVKRIEENGEEVEVETGVGLNPETGKMGPYEEVWKEQNIPPGTPFAFLMSDPNPRESTRFLAVLGPHAMGLSQGEGEDGRLSAIQSGESGTFHAVRLRTGKPEGLLGKMPLLIYETVFSTGCRSLDDQLRALLTALTAREREGKEPWQRGESIVLMEGREGKPWTWVVWDAGYA
ncbi:hypothetical protein HYDPIDRAFT_116612 [Hydnomerulius pinastri MD-312]|uniref:Unplaced genomic scaffold scaffold_33, whole genome shotgun sequence n=1 Tax=Hydnomerulius pinastri MD-312 TaxID=994086 RepID=A0A0C9V5R8_9AGAM|nr:hypothetical protein HYDPIDRAFT_116612 [Hydnomerulius pinastri MD-312]